MIVVLALLFVMAPQPGAQQISEAQKKEFIELLKTLPHKGEFFSDEAVKTAGPYLPVLFALTGRDLEAYDLYPFMAISRGLCAHKEHRRYAITHFGEMRHAALKISWAAMLFNEGERSPKIVQFLRGALRSHEQAGMLAEALGPGFADFRRRVNAAAQR